MQYQYGGAYNANSAYMVPMGVSPVMAQKMMTASNAFRYFDKDHTGTLSKDGEYNKQNILKNIYTYILINIYVYLFNLFIIFLFFFFIYKK